MENAVGVVDKIIQIGVYWVVLTYEPFRFETCGPHFWTHKKWTEYGEPFIPLCVVRNSVAEPEDELYFWF